MAVAPDRIDVEEVRQSHFADAELEAANGDFRRQAQIAAVGIDHLVGQPDRLMNLSTRQVRRGAEIRITDDIEICESREAKGLAEAASTSAFSIDNEVGVVAQISMRLERGIKRTDERYFGFNRGQETVRSLVW